MPNSLPRWPSSVLVLLVASALTVSVVGASSLDPSVDIRKYFAGLPAVPAAILICLLGGAALLFLEKRFDLVLVSAQFHWRGTLISVGAAIPFMVSVTLLDLTLSFASDINVMLPIALGFYPAMGFLAQLSLHIVPFALMLWLLTCFTSWTRQTCFWLALIVAALPESLFQMDASVGGEGNTLLLGALVAVQLFLFGIVELNLYRRYDFVCMYVFRLTYYAYWHIIWGALRLH